MTLAHTDNVVLRENADYRVCTVYPALLEFPVLPVILVPPVSTAKTDAMAVPDSPVFRVCPECRDPAVTPV